MGGQQLNAFSHCGVYDHTCVQCCLIDHPGQTQQLKQDCCLAPPPLYQLLLLLMLLLLRVPGVC
jgi:hypothetical protein